MQSVRRKLVTPASIAANYLVMWFDTPKPTPESIFNLAVAWAAIQCTPTAQPNKARHGALTGHRESYGSVVFRLLLSGGGGGVAVPFNVLVASTGSVGLQCSYCHHRCGWMDGNMVFIGNDKRVLEATRTINHRIAVFQNQKPASISHNCEKSTCGHHHHLHHSYLCIHPSESPDCRPRWLPTKDKTLENCN